MRKTQVFTRQISMALVAIMGFCVPNLALAGDNFRARVTLKLCPEYQLGGVGVEVDYQTPYHASVQQATVVSWMVNAASNTGTFDILLPDYYGTTPIDVTARCINRFGYGEHSAAVQISNCDALKLVDADGDGLANNLEDLNCDNFYSPGDVSNPDNLDTDGDGVRDLTEVFAGTDPSNPGSSPRPFILKGGPFDPDGDDIANAVVWRPSNGVWYIRDFVTEGSNLEVQYGMAGDVPFLYQPWEGALSDLGLVRLGEGNDYVWLFRGPGYQSSMGALSAINFGIFGDNLIPGPWEAPGVTTPAVARLFNGMWTFYIFLSDGSVRTSVWGGNGDVLRPADYDGDGLYDIAVFRPSEHKTFIVNSSDGGVRIIDFSTGTSEHTFRGDVTGDGREDVVFWEPINGMFSSLKSEDDFDFATAFDFQLGLYNVHLPLSYIRRDGMDYFSVIDHASGLRYTRTDNAPDGLLKWVQWGLPGDSQG